MRTMNQGKKIVVVEDDTWLREYYIRRLEEAGFKVFPASHAIEAIDIIDKIKPDAILLDVLLVGTTALTLLHELCSHSDLANIPVVIASNAADTLSLKDVAPYGVKKIIDKSTMDPDEIKAALISVI